MTDDSLLPFDLPSVQRKKVSAAFDGGLISSDGGLVLLREVERRLGLAEALAGCIRDRRNQAQVVHPLSTMLRFRMLAIACGYEDADDCDALRMDPLFKVAAGKAPESGRALCSQPTMSRLENTPSRTEVARMTAALVDLFCRSFPTPPAAITLDIDDTCDAVHGHQQLSLFHGHYDTRCFLPVHVYHVESGKPVAILLRPGKTPSGPEVRTLIKHLVRRIRRHWPRTRIVFRGDAHYGRAEAMAWCEENGVDYTSSASPAIARCTLSHTRWPTTSRSAAPRPVQTGCAPSPTSPTPHAPGAANAGSSPGWRRVPRGFDARYIVTSLRSEPRHLYEMSTGGWDVTLSEGDPANPETFVSNIGTYPDALDATHAAMESVADEMHKAQDDIEFLIERYGGELVEKLPRDDGTRVCGIAECDNPIGEGRTSLCDECAPLRYRAQSILSRRRSREKLRELRDTSANVA